MAFLFIYFLLTLQSDIISSSCNIVNCDTDYTCNGNLCSRCLPGYYKHFAGNCRKCYLVCQICNGGQCYDCNPPECVNGTDICDYATCDKAGCSGNAFVRCSGCPDGFYLDGNNFCVRCDYVNCKCHFANSCDQCLPGYHDTNTLCSKCAPGKYGQSCEHNCIRACGDGTCDKESGTCLTQCALYEYLDDAGRCQPCPTSRCASCVNSTFCSSCKQSFNWGPICNYDCVGCITSCNRNDGCSAGCPAPEYYNTYNTGKKGYECVRCFSQCKTCDNDAYCSSCKDNFWGQKCLYSCNNCAGTCDKDYGCIDNCELGYYRERIDAGYECKPCSEHCEQCIDTSTCQECKDGYYVDDISKICIPCSINCTDNVCDSSNGTCKSGCLPGSSGYRCNEQCPTNCFECEQFHSSHCVSCQSEFYGEYCVNVCSQNCKATNATHACLREDGTCKHGCEAGFWSKTCTEACHQRCVDKVCNERSGKCSHGCIPGFHGSNCSLVCPTKCCGNKCFQDNGTCVVEFISESTTSLNVEDSDATPQRLADLDSNNSAIIGLAVVVGIVCIFAVASIILNVFQWKSRKASQPTTHDLRSHESDRQLTDISLARQSENVGYEDLTSVRPEEKMYSSITHEYENTNISA